MKKNLSFNFLNFFLSHFASGYAKTLKKCQKLMQNSDSFKTSKFMQKIEWK